MDQTPLDRLLQEEIPTGFFGRQGYRPAVKPRPNGTVQPDPLAAVHRAVLAEALGIKPAEAVEP